MTEDPTDSPSSENAHTGHIYDEIADSYYETNNDRSVIADQVDQFAATVGDGRILDVGCGPGWESAAFAAQGFDVVGIDLSSRFVRMAATEAPTAAILQMDMRQLGLAKNSVDGVWACASLLHVPRQQLEVVLEEFSRVLRPGGSLYISVKAGAGRRRGGGHGPADTRQFVLYTATELRTAADRFVTVEELESQNGWLNLWAAAP